MNAFFLSLLFLTRLPVGYNVDWNEADCGKSVRYFVIVGAILGCINVAAAYFFCQVVPFFLGEIIFPPVLAFLLLLVHIASTGALHCDGYTDTMDGLLSGRSAERILEIMKDSRVGAHGATALILLILGKYAVFYALCAMAAGKNAFSAPFLLLCTAVFLAPVLGRLAMVLCVTLFPYARKEGIGKAFSLYSGRGSFVFNLILAAFLAAFSPIGAINAIVAYFFVLLFASYAGNHLTKKLGGLTGDIYGAVTELSEWLVLFLFTLYF